jgi:uncharacterized protein with ParB-like and HNH nuclease domain
MSVTSIPQTIEEVFSTTTYYIDFYQRQYKWDKEPVERLLDDVFYKFNQDYQKNNSSIEADIVGGRISSYFLNTYVTNTITNKVYLVDGQQRFTTITLMLIQLFQLGQQFGSSLTDWVKSKIHGISGPKRIFWLQHEYHLTTLEDLLNDIPFSDIKTGSGISALNMVENSKFIRAWFEKELRTYHQFESFVYYMLRNIQIVKLDVTQDDVPMVFEVLNDRGVRLKPHEILKGKLLGQIDKQELEKLELNMLWDEQVSLINLNNPDDIDNFFEIYIRSKIANSRGTSEKYTSKNYHRILFIGEVEDYFKLNRNAGKIKKFLLNEYKYFSNLYNKIKIFRTNFTSNFEYLYFNQLNELSLHFVLILSSCKLNDVEEDDKIKIISYQYDRLFALLHLQKAYVNNIISDLVYTISNDIRERKADEIANIFQKHLLSALSQIKATTVVESFNYNYFQDVGYADLPTRFKRYFFARIDYFISKSINSQTLPNFENLVRNSGSVNGYHIEHILAHNTENLTLFNNDDQVFERERNRLGGLLLLKGNANQSSGNESYADKLRTYVGTLLWNETLHSDTYHSNPDLQSFMNQFGLVLKPVPAFGPNELEERHKLLSQIIQIIWK